MMQAQWALAVLCLVNAVAAFPAINQQTSLTRINRYCIEMALNSILGTSQLPLPEQVNYLLRDSNKHSDYLAPMDNNFRISRLVSLKSPRIGIGMTNPAADSEMIDMLRTGLGEFSRLRNECILINGGTYGIGDATYTDDISAKIEDIVPAERETLIPSTGNGLKRSGLALNPTGWRRKRDTTPRYQTMREFLRSIRQLQIKRKERIQFNPTGW